MKRATTGALLALATALLAVFPGAALVSSSDRGQWPDDWPVDLEPFRDRATTIMVGTGIQMNIYQIPFQSREEFEAVWLSCLDLKSPGATLRLLSPSAQAEWPGEANEGAAIRFLAPSGGFSIGPEARDLVGEGTTHEQMLQLVEEGKVLQSEYPWPETAYLDNGDLAEYVQPGQVDGKLAWVPIGDEGERRGFMNRARVDIELVVDGEIIDLNRIHLPDNTRIIDEREL